MYQPLDLSKSNDKKIPKMDNAEKVISQPIYATKRISPVFTNIGHQLRKDKGCSLSWSTTFGSAIPTTATPANIASLPITHSHGFAIPPSPPPSASLPPEREFLPRPSHSNIFPFYGLPLSPTENASKSRVSFPTPSYYGCYCCTDLQNTTQRIPEYFTPKLAFHSYGDSVNAITAHNRRFMNGHPDDILTPTKTYPQAEQFYQNQMNQLRNDSVHHQQKELCELWKYDGERIGYLPSGSSSTYKLAAKSCPSAKIYSDESDDGNPIKQTRDSKSEQDNLLPCNKNSEKGSGKTSSLIKSPTVETFERPEKPEDNTNETSLGSKDIEQVCTEDSKSDENNTLRRPKTKDSIGPGYIEMIARAILNSKSKRCMLTDIYKYITTTYSRYRDDTVCWRNIVRHHLSHYECFVKAEHNGHAHYWTINPDMEEDFANGKFHRKRRPNRRKRAISSNKIISAKPSTLDSTANPLAHWIPSTLYRYYQDEVAKPYVYLHRRYWIDDDPVRNNIFRPYLLDSKIPKNPLEKTYH